MTTKTTRAVRFLPVMLLLAVFAIRGVGCRKKEAPGAGPVVTPHSKRPWITPLQTIPPAPPTPTLWRTDITRVPTLPE